MRRRDRPARRRGTAGLRIAACLAGFLLAAGLVVRVSVSFTTTSPRSQQEIGTREGAVALSTDVAGRPLFDDVFLVPGEPVESCIQVRAHSSRDVGPLGIYLGGYSGTSAMADALRVVVERRGQESAVPVGSCAGFAPEATVLAGTLADLFRAHPDGGSAAGLEEAERSRGKDLVSWYRVRVVLPADAPSDALGGHIDELDLVWTTMPLPSEPSTGEQAVLLALQVAEGSVVPLLLMLVAAVLFIGIQDRIDRADPKLALAPVLQEELPFEQQ